MESRGKPRHSRLVREFLSLRQKVGELEAFKAESTGALEVLNKFRTLFTHADDLAFICDPAGNIIYLNDVFEGLTGSPPGDFHGRPLTSLYEDAGAEKALEYFNRALNGERLLYELSFKNSGKVCEYRTSPLRDETGKVTGVMGIAREITHRKGIEAAFEEHKKTLEALIREKSSELRALREKLEKITEERDILLKRLKGSEP